MGNRERRRRQRQRKRRRRHLGRMLLLTAVAAGGLYAGVHCFFRAPEPSADTSAVLEKLEQTQEQKETESAQQLSAIDRSQAAHTARKPYFYTILLSGQDDGNGNSDTNILIGFDGQNGKICGVSIPRDTKAIIHGKKQKINAAFGIGGSELLAQVISEQLGIPVDFTMSVDLSGFQALVDAIGGVDFDVPVNMNYDDPYQDLSIHFSKGMQHLSGTDALKVVRFRHNNDGTGYGSEDIGRMQTQQKFLKAVAQQTLTLSNLTKVSDFVKIFQQYIDTNLSLSDMAWFATEAIKMGTDAISFTTMPNEWHSPYVYLTPDETLTVVNECLNPYVEDRTMDDLQLQTR